MKGYVYKISNADESIIYIGSTARTLRQRWSFHKSDYKRWLNGERNGCSIFRHFQQHGIDNFTMYLISEHEITDRKQLFEFEQLAIDRTQCINQIKAYLTDAERIERNRNINRRHHRFVCDCGSHGDRRNRPTHERTQKHQRWLAEQKPPSH
jgi:hypothetical protein